MKVVLKSQRIKFFLLAFLPLPLVAMLSGTIAFLLLLFVPETYDESIQNEKLFWGQVACLTVIAIATWQTLEYRAKKPGFSLKSLWLTLSLAWMMQVVIFGIFQLELFMNSCAVS